MYGAVPPVAVMVTVELPPLQRIGVQFAWAFTGRGPPMVTVTMVEQPLVSITVKVCVPVGRRKVPVPVYGGIPPVAVTVTVELSRPQSTGVYVAEATRGVGSVITIDTSSVQPFASVTVKV